MSLNLHIVTPSRNLLNTVCEDVVLPGFDGEMGVLSQHAYFVNKLGAGIVTIHKAGETQKLAIAGGVVEIGADQVTVLADEAVFAKEIVVSKLEQDQKKVAASLLELSESPADREKLFQRQSWITAQFQLLQDK